MGLSDDQITKLLEWFVNSSEVNKEWSNRRKQGQEQAHEWLQPEKLKDLSDEELSNKFRDYYKRGSGDKQHLIQLNRERVLRDIKKLRKTIDYTLDESIDMPERLNQVLRHTIATGTIRQYHLNLPFLRFAPFLLIPFFRMLSFSQNRRWKYQDDQKYQA